jgi:LuxR family maltose regulon positive regulatory protein
LAQGTTESLRQATDLLDHLDDFVVSLHNTRFRIDILALQALLNDCQDNGAAALKKLTESLALAEPGGFLRNYVDLGPPMAELLKRMRDHHPAGDDVEKILASFRNDEEMIVPEATGLSSPSQPLIDPLTHREIDVLELLAQRFRNKEIADKLFVSPETVKAHLHNIYQKLNVSKRREAVEKAKKLRIL